MGCVNVSMRKMSELEELRAIPLERIAVIDVETTGLRPGRDEVLQVSACNGEGTILLNAYVRPPTRKRWPKAQEVHGISWQMVRDQPPFEEFADALFLITQECDLLVGYNIEFDLSMLESEGLRVTRDVRNKCYDLMHDCSVLYGTWSENYGEYRYISLTKAAHVYGIEYEPHKADSDVQATSAVLRALLSDPKLEDRVQKREREIEKRQQEKEMRRRLREEEEKRRKEERDLELKKLEEQRQSEGFTLRHYIGFVLIGIVLFAYMQSCIRG